MYAAIEIPGFALQAVLRTVPERCLKPSALVRGGVVEALTPWAYREGVRHGMTVPQALARCAELRVVEADPVREACARAALLQHASALSPLVEDTAQGLCVADLRMRRGGAFELEARRLLATLAEDGLKARVGVGPDPELARLLAGMARPYLEGQDAGAIAGLPVEALGAGVGAAEVLRGWGIVTAGELARLKRGEVMRRLGAEGAVLWDLASGRATRPIRPVKPPMEFVERYEFERSAETLEPLLFVLRASLERMLGRMRAVYRMVAGLRLVLGCDGGGEHRRDFRIPQPTGDLAVLMRILETHLETVRTVRPIRMVVLEGEPSVATSEQFELFGGALRDPNRYFATLARLRALLGEDRAGVPESLDVHRPDAFRMREPEALYRGSTEEVLGGSLGPAFRRLRPPCAAAVFFEDGRPRWVTSERVNGRVERAAGPFETSGEWWDGEGWAREEWDVELSDGTLLMLVLEGGKWVVEGFYD